MEKHTSKFATALQKAMADQNLSIRDLVEKVASVTEDDRVLTYEHVRRLVNGIAFPSENTTKLLAKALGIDRKALHQYATEDRITHKYGKTATVLAGRNPELAPIEAIWPHLSQARKDDLIRMAKMFVQEEGGGSTKKVARA